MGGGAVSIADGVGVQITFGVTPDENEDDSTATNVCGVGLLIVWR